MGHIPNVWKLFAIRFFNHLIPAYVIERLFWEERGMTIQMVVYTEIIFAFTIVLFEVPSGILADRWGRKKLLICAALLGCLEFLLLVFATAFWHFALVVFLAAIGHSASSGAEDALLYDSLAVEAKESQFEKVVGRLNAWGLVAVILAALSGSFLASQFGLELNYWISLCAMAVSLAVTLLLAEPARIGGRADDGSLPFKQYLLVSLRFFRRNKGLSLVMLSGMVMGAAINFIDEFWQIYLERLDIPVLYFGVFSAAIFLLRLPGNMLAYKLKHWISYRALLLGITGVLTLGFFYISMTQHYSSLIAIVVICTAAGVIEPLAAGYLHHRIDSSMRATMGSFQSFGENVLLTVTGLGFGYFSSKLDIFGGFGFLSVICSLFFIYFCLRPRRL